MERGKREGGLEKEKWRERWTKGSGGLEAERKRQKDGSGEKVEREDAVPRYGC